MHIIPSFTKPPIGGNNALLEIEILNEMIMEVYQSETFVEYKSQLKNFKVHMVGATYNSPPISVPISTRLNNNPSSTVVSRTVNVIARNEVIQPSVEGANEIVPIEKEFRIDDKSYKVSWVFDKNLPNSTFNWVNLPSDSNSIGIELKLNSDLELIKMFITLIDKHSEMQNESGEAYALIIKKLLN